MCVRIMNTVCFDEPISFFFNIAGHYYLFYTKTIRTKHKTLDIFNLTVCIFFYVNAHFLINRIACLRNN